MALAYPKGVAKAPLLSFVKKIIVK